MKTAILSLALMIPTMASESCEKAQSNYAAPPPTATPQDWKCAQCWPTNSINVCPAIIAGPVVTAMYASEASAKSTAALHLTGAGLYWACFIPSCFPRMLGAEPPPGPTPQTAGGGGGPPVCLDAGACGAVGASCDVGCCDGLFCAGATMTCANPPSPGDEP